MKGPAAKQEVALVMLADSVEAAVQAYGDSHRRSVKPCA